MSKSLIVAILFIISISIGAAQAQLTWDATQLEVEPTGQNVAATARFTYKNSGRYTLSIIRVHPLEAGVTANVTKTSLAPGERGEVVVAVADRLVGLPTEVSARVFSDEWKSQPALLTLHLLPPKVPYDVSSSAGGWAAHVEYIRSESPPIQIEPERLFWMPGEALDAKPVTVRSSSQAPLEIEHFRQIVGSADGFDLVITKDETEPKYTVAVKPRASSGIGSVGCWHLAAPLHADDEVRQKVHGAPFLTAVVFGQPARD